MKPDMSMRYLNTALVSSLRSSPTWTVTFSKNSFMESRAIPAAMFKHEA